MEKAVRLSQTAAPASRVTGSLLALMRSGSSRPFSGEGPRPDQAVLAVINDLPVGRYEIGHQRRYADAKIDHHAILHVLCGAAGDEASDVLSFHDFS